MSRKGSIHKTERKFSPRTGGYRGLNYSIFQLAAVVGRLKMQQSLDQPKPRATHVEQPQLVILRVLGKTRVVL